MSDLSQYINNDVVIILLAFIVALYASSLRIEMPDLIKNLFQNSIFQIIFLTLLLIFAFKQSIQVAFIIALVFVLVIYFLNTLEVEKFSQNRREKLEQMMAKL